MEHQINQIITNEQPAYAEAASWCNNNNARIIALDSGAYQIVTIPAPTTEELADSVRTERDARITACDWIVIRHAEQVAMGATTTLSDDEYAAWLEYRQALRDLPTLEGFPWSGGGESDTDCPWPVESTVG